MKTEEKYCKNADAEALKELLMLRMDGMERLTEGRFTSSQLALDLGAKETERRLDLLNGEAERLRLIQATYLPREVYDANYSELRKEIVGLNSSRDIQNGRNSVLSGVIAFTTSVLLIVIGHFVGIL